MEEKKRIRLDEEPWRVILNAAYSIENMEGHGAGNRSVSYIGSLPGRNGQNEDRQGGSRHIYDLYRDSQGKHWYESCVKLPSGRIISMEHYIFGKEIRRR
jgi:hypothetical protein